MSLNVFCVFFRQGPECWGENKVSFVQGELVTKAGPLLWGLRWVFSFQLLVFLLEKQLVGQGGMSPGMRGAWRCLHPKKNLPCPHHPAKHPNQQADNIRTSCLLAFSSHSHIFLEVLSLLWHRESPSMKVPKKCVDVALPTTPQEKSPQLSPRFCFSSIGR